MSASQRRKGHSFEREVARRMRVIYPDARRGYQTRTGKDGCDVEGTPWHVECKVGKRPNAKAALEQAERDTDGRPCVAVLKWDRMSDGDEVVVMRWRDFERLVNNVSR